VRHCARIPSQAQPEKSNFTNTRSRQTGPGFNHLHLITRLLIQALSLLPAQDNCLTLQPRFSFNSTGAGRGYYNFINNESNKVTGIEIATVAAPLLQNSLIAASNPVLMLYRQSRPEEISDAVH
jgi:hypothetical protein